MRVSALLMSLLAASLAAPVAAQAPAGGLAGLDAETTRILVEAGRNAQPEIFAGMLRGARDDKLAALEQDPVDWSLLVRAIETEKALETLRAHRMLDAELEAFARMKPAQRKAVAASARKLRQSVLEMQAQPRN